MDEKGKEQNCSLLWKIATDIITFRGDYWFVLTGETLMSHQNFAQYANKMFAEVSLPEATKI